MKSVDKMGLLAYLKVIDLAQSAVIAEFEVAGPATLYAPWRIDHGARWPRGITISSIAIKTMAACWLSSKHKNRLPGP